MSTSPTNGQPGASEIAGEENYEPELAEAERLARIGLDLRDKKIDMLKAFQVAAEIAARRRVPAYKTENGFVNAMRKARLILKGVIYAKTPYEWIESPEPENPIVGEYELTSVRAVEELFNQRAEQRRLGDRKRKKVVESGTLKSTSKKNSEKIVRKFQSKKRIEMPEKRNRTPEKRKGKGEKRKVKRNP